MSLSRKVLIGVLSAAALGMGLVLSSGEAQFVLGGAMVNAGYRMQDHLKSYDFEHRDDITAEQVWEEFKAQNESAASVRKAFPRSTYHPLVAMLVCMDARIDTNELAGDTRRSYYVVRTAGSAMSPKEQEMLELAVVNGVKLVVLTRHTDCAAEKVAADPVKRAQFPALAQAVDERDAMMADFFKRPLIAERISKGQLVVKMLLIDTKTEELMDGNEHGHAHGETDRTLTRTAAAR